MEAHTQTYDHNNFLQGFQLTVNSAKTKSHKLDHNDFVHQPDLHQCVCVCLCVCVCVCGVCVFTSESSRGCTWLSVTIAINSDDSELIADPRPKALQWD